MHHEHTKNLCALDSITVGTHEANPTQEQCTDCLSFEDRYGTRKLPEKKGDGSYEFRLSFYVCTGLEKIGTCSFAACQALCRAPGHIDKQSVQMLPALLHRILQEVTAMASSFPRPLTEQEERMYVEKLQQGDADARSRLIEHNLRLVAHIAKKYTSPGASQDDLISIGTIGLIKAVSTYTAGRATRLATYAAKCIENEILMSIRASKRIKQEVSLSLPIGTDKDGNEISFNDILGTDTDEIIDDISLKIQVAKLYRTIAKVLTPRERTVIIKRYGLDGGEALPQREIASALGISRSYVSRIEKKALEKLRSGLEEGQS